MIEITNLNKRVGERVLLSNLTTKLYSGRIYGVVSTDGVATTAFLSLLSGGWLPTEGSVRINGFDLRTDPLRAKRCLGYAPAEPLLADGVTVEELLRFVAEAKAVPFERAVRQIKDATELCGLEPLQKKLLCHLTPAESAAVGLAQAMLGGAEILILDRPLEALSPAENARMQGVLHSLARMGRTLILGLSRLSEAEALCDDVLLLSEGSLLANLPLSELDRVLAQDQAPSREAFEHGALSPTADRGNASSQYEILEDEEVEE